jgi:1-aminocyclopropane-1-carboxylate deaminase
MANVSILRLDRLSSAAPGNKQFKLALNMQLARQQGAQTLVSCGGAWSNHLHALAALGQRQGFRTVGVIRGERPAKLSPTLQDALGWGMELLFVTREQYRQRHTDRFQRQLQQQYRPCLVIPEGGANLAGVKGCAEIATLVQAHAPAAGRVMLAVGTGATLAGLVGALPPEMQVQGVCVLKGAKDVEARIAGWLAQLGRADCASWQVLHDYHCGGYARASAALQAFIQAFERVQNLPLDPVYTGKLLFAIHQRLQQGRISADQHLVAIHTGGLQGRRGYCWLA